MAGNQIMSPKPAENFQSAQDIEGASLFRTRGNQTQCKAVVEHVEVSFSLDNFEDKTHLGDKDSESERRSSQDRDFVQHRGSFATE